jgi:hypothetical protein
MRIVIVGPAFPYKDGGAHHTPELAHRIAGVGHEAPLASLVALSDRVSRNARGSIVLINGRKRL